MNPILYLIIIIGINTLIKSAAEKKKIEEAKMKRADQISKSPTMDKAKSKDLMTRINEEIEGNLKKRGIYKQNMNMDVGANKEKKQETIDVINKVPSYSQDASEKKQEKLNLEQNKPRVCVDSELNIKKDLLKGIIYSEILSEPKSIQNLKRGM